VREFGGTRFAVPPGGRFIRINRHTGERVGDDATGPDIVAEYFREGEEPVFGIAAIIDGGFQMGMNLPIFGQGEADAAEIGTQTLTNATGQQVVVPSASSFGTISAGGLY
jgi:penicillin-binding protein 1A